MSPGNRLHVQKDLWYLPLFPRYESLFLPYLQKLIIELALCHKQRQVSIQTIAQRRRQSVHCLQSSNCLAQFMPDEILDPGGTVRPSS